MNVIEQEGHDAFVLAISRHMRTTFALACSICPYALGDSRRVSWFKGWYKAKWERA